MLTEKTIGNKESKIDAFNINTVFGIQRQLIWGKRLRGRSYLI